MYCASITLNSKLLVRSNLSFHKQVQEARDFVASTLRQYQCAIINPLQLYVSSIAPIWSPPEGKTSEETKPNDRGYCTEDTASTEDDNYSPESGGG